MAHEPVRVLLIEPDPKLREIDELVLEGDGYAVETLPEGADPVAFVEQTQPRLVVLGIHATDSAGWQILDRLDANPTTRKTSVVVIASSQQVAARAQATPIARYAVVEPFRIAELEQALAKALKNPLPSAVLPPARRPTSLAIAFATRELAQHARTIVLQTVRELQETEPYQSRFTELTPGLVDNLQVMLSAITQGLARSLPPSEVFAVPAIRRPIQEHVELRRRQGIDLASAVQEYQLMSLQVGSFLGSLVGHDHFTGWDAFDIDERISRYTDELVRQVIRGFTLAEEPSVPMKRPA